MGASFYDGKNAKNMLPEKYYKIPKTRNCRAPATRPCGGLHVHKF